LEDAGGRVLSLPDDQQGRVDLSSLLDCLGELGVSSLMVEGGAAVISSFLTHSLVDLAVLTIAPVFLGGLKSLEEGALRSDGIAMGKQPMRLFDTGYTQMGEDLVLWGRLADSGAF
jgi:diaminohydroxyphosphoribosylaminopyrimidine deaminase/5-amino-6-(5-phosphoribosylamino)uracil reductase